MQHDHFRMQQCTGFHTQSDPQPTSLLAHSLSFCRAQTRDVHMHCVGVVTAQGPAFVAFQTPCRGSLSGRAATAATWCLQQPSIVKSNSVCSSRGRSWEAKCTLSRPQKCSATATTNSAENCSCIGSQQTHSTHAMLVCMAVECIC